VLRATLPQVVVHPTASPTLNDGGWVYNAAILLFVLGALLLLLIVFGYMRLAPRFQTEEGARKSVRAPRIQPGKDTRRPVNVTGTPLAVEPPAVAMATVASAPAPATASASALVAAPAPAPAAAPPEAGAGGGAAGGSPTAATPTSTDAAVGDSPGGPPPATDTPEAPAPAPTPAPAAGERKEVTLDQETFDRVLAELLDKGTDRRVAEGQARRAAMIAARKKAEG
jgi:hypothetical protein